MPIPLELREEAEASPTPAYALVALYDGATLYPIDYFNCVEEMLELPRAYELRLWDLNSHLARSLPLSTDCSPVVTVLSGDTLAERLVEIGFTGQDTSILINDSNSWIDGTYVRVPVTLASGVIDSIWSDDLVRGFKVWFNGKLCNCTYPFYGKDSAILGYPASVKGRVMSFFYLENSGEEYLIGSAIEWAQKRWRPRKLRGTEIMLNGCAMCGSTKWSHANRGLCKSCEANLPYYFQNNSDGNWIAPSPQRSKKRLKVSWRAELLNVVQYKHKGCTLEARADGCWRFNNTNS
jgi:hypothetical protein